MESPIRTVLVTAPDREAAERLGRALVEERLAACANLLPGVSSIFRWEGEIHLEEEVLLILKTTEDRLGSLTTRVEDLHPYDVPEVLALRVDQGSGAYEDWVVRETRPVSGIDRS